MNGLVDDEPGLTAVNSAPLSPPTRAAPLGSRGAVGAISKALTQLASDRGAEARVADEVVDIDAGLLLDSLFKDRLEAPGAGIASLVASIKEAGQQVPILVRPAPMQPGKYQIAYGHRRAAAARELGRPVRAFIRSLTDEQLIIAQGTENGERKDLSFIERAYFAFMRELDGISRTTICVALSVDKTELSRLISVARSISFDVIEAIGPAPKMGRRRWIQFAERLALEPTLVEVRSVMGSEQFKALEDSNTRFLKLLAAAPHSRGRNLNARTWTDEAGRKLVRVTRADGRFILSIDEKFEPTFGDYLFDNLPQILAAFQSRGEDGHPLSVTARSSTASEAPQAAVADEAVEPPIGSPKR